MEQIERAEDRRPSTGRVQTDLFLLKYLNGIVPSRFAVGRLHRPQVSYIYYVRVPLIQFTGVAK